MPGIFDEAAAAMQRAAKEREEAEKAKRRAALQRKIDDLNGKLSKVNNQMSRLINEERILGMELNEWEVQKNKCKGNLLLSGIVLVNRFEGVCADRIKKDFTSCVTEMNNTYLKTGRLRSDDSAQIQRLNQYKSSINDKIVSLTREMNAI